VWPLESLSKRGRGCAGIVVLPKYVEYREKQRWAECRGYEMYSKQRMSSEQLRDILMVEQQTTLKKA